MNDDYLFIYQLDPQEQTLVDTKNTNIFCQGNVFENVILLTHHGLVTPYGNIDLHQHWFR